MYFFMATLALYLSLSVNTRSQVFSTTSLYSTKPKILGLYWSFCIDHYFHYIHFLSSLAVFYQLSCYFRRISNFTRETSCLLQSPQTKRLHPSFKREILPNPQMLPGILINFSGADAQVAIDFLSKCETYSFDDRSFH
jgi:hypothetical protein